MKDKKDKEKALLLSDELLELCESLYRLSPDFFMMLSRLLKMPCPTTKREKVKMLRMVSGMCLESLATQQSQSTKGEKDND